MPLAAHTLCVPFLTPVAVTHVCQTEDHVDIANQDLVLTLEQHEALMRRKRMCLCLGLGALIGGLVFVYLEFIRKK